MFLVVKQVYRIRSEQRGKNRTERCGHIRPDRGQIRRPHQQNRQSHVQIVGHRRIQRSDGHLHPRRG